MELTVSKRDITKKPKLLREEGILPAVVYGRKDESTPISVDRKTFEKVFHAAGESTVISLVGLGENKDALIHDVTVDPVSGVVLHADFYAIAKGQTVTVSVPFEFEGESAAVRDLGGILLKVMHELELEVVPKDLPHAIMVDISTLKTFEDKITVGDLKLPASAKITAGAEEVVAMVTEPKEEVVEEVVADISQIEMSVEKGKKEEEGEGEAASSEEAKS